MERTYNWVLGDLGSVFSIAFKPVGISHFINILFVFIISYTG